MFVFDMGYMFDFNCVCKVLFVFVCLERFYEIFRESRFVYYDRSNFYRGFDRKNKGLFRGSNKCDVYLVNSKGLKLFRNVIMEKEKFEE